MIFFHYIKDFLQCPAFFAREAKRMSHLAAEPVSAVFTKTSTAGRVDFLPLGGVVLPGKG